MSPSQLESLNNENRIGQLTFRRFIHIKSDRLHRWVTQHLKQPTHVRKQRLLS
jgi:hypothetical protein